VLSARRGTRRNAYSRQTRVQARERRCHVLAALFSFLAKSTVVTAVRGSSHVRSWRACRTRRSLSSAALRARLHLSLHALHRAIHERLQLRVAASEFVVVVVVLLARVFTLLLLRALRVVTLSAARVSTRLMGKTGFAALVVMMRVIR